MYEVPLGFFECLNSKTAGFGQNCVDELRMAVGNPRMIKRTAASVRWVEASLNQAAKSSFAEP